MESDPTAISQLNGYEMDKKQRQNLFVRIRNLPLGVWEGLLQKNLEQHAAVKRVDVKEEIHQATVELENAVVRRPRTSTSFD